MSKKVKTRKPVTSKSKGLIALCIMCVITVCLGVLAVCGIGPPLRVRPSA